jgi:hypothetical protein
MKEAMKTLGQIVLVIAAAIAAGIAIGYVLAYILNNLYYANTIY